VIPKPGESFMTAAQAAATCIADLKLLIEELFRHSISLSNRNRVGRSSKVERFELTDVAAEVSNGSKRSE
jgi:hypothetical protein